MSVPTGNHVKLMEKRVCTVLTGSATHVLQVLFQNKNLAMFVRAVPAESTVAVPVLILTWMILRANAYLPDATTCGSVPANIILAGRQLAYPACVIRRKREKFIRAGRALADNALNYF